MNTKDKHYKEWLAKITKVHEMDWEYPTSREYDEAWDDAYYNPKYKKFNRWYSNPPKWYINLFNRSDRQHNKQALKKNLNTMVCDWDGKNIEDFLDADWFDCYNEWQSDDVVEYRYKPRNSAKWMYW